MYKYSLDYAQQYKKHMYVQVETVNQLSYP
jgi:hypothetical protein